MIVRGSIYVLTTPVSPDLCRIAFSAKSPELRVKEMMRKKPDQRFIIEYAVVVDQPHRYCQRAREKLTQQGKHEWKEWFRCTPEEAAVAIRDAIGRARIYSETVRGVERLRREEEVEKKAIPVTSPGRGADQKAASDVVVTPLQDGGERRRKGEEEIRREALAAAAEKKAAPEPSGGSVSAGEMPPTNAIATAVKQATIQEQAKPATASVIPESPEIQHYILKQQEEMLQKEKEDVRLALEERRKGTEREKGETKKKKHWIPGRATEEHGSLFWEITITFLADVGCLYLVFAAKGTFITVVGIVLVVFFTLLLIDSFRTLRERRKRSLPKGP